MPQDSHQQAIIRIVLRRIDEQLGQFPGDLIDRSVQLSGEEWGQVKALLTDFVDNPADPGPPGGLRVEPRDT